MAEATAREIFARFVRTGVERDLSAQADLYASDGVLEWPFAPAGMPRRTEGREAIRRVLAGLHAGADAAGLRVTGVREVAVHDTTDPEVIIAEFEVQAEAGTTPTTLPYVQVYRVRAGEIVSLRDYWSPATAAAVTAPA
jgi:ketosteroid isomerase-like protein